MSKRWVIGAWVLLTLVGCGRSPALVPISGTVTQQGKPLAGVEVVFVTADGTGYTATTDEQGRYSTPGKGIPAGSYVVLLREPVPFGKLAGERQPGLPGDPARHAQKLQAVGPNRIPRSYSLRDQTPLREVAVGPGQPRHDFDLPRFR
jgi:hypothetical protein